MRRILILPVSEQKEILYACALLSYYDVYFGTVAAEHQKDVAVAYGHNFDVIAADYDTIYATVFPTTGPPQRP